MIVRSVKQLSFNYWLILFFLFFSLLGFDNKKKDVGNATPRELSTRKMLKNAFLSIIARKEKEKYTKLFCHISLRCFFVFFKKIKKLNTVNRRPVA